jgi:hypothetical protein
MPPGFPYKWVGDELIKRFTENGLEMEDIEPAPENDHIILSVRAKEIIRFNVPSYGKKVTGYIFCFDKREAFEKTKKHYLDLNKKGELYTWSFSKDNILLVLAGSMPEESARRYEKVLYEIKE